MARPPRGLRLGLPCLAGGVVRAGAQPVARRGGGLRVRSHRGSRRGRWWRDVPRRPHNPRARIRRCEVAVAPSRAHRSAPLVPVVQRAGQRLGPRGPHHAGGAGRRRVGDYRPEAVDHRCREGGLGDPRGPHQLRRAQAQGHYLLRHRHAPTRYRGAAPHADEPVCVVQRGVPHRGTRADAQRDRRSG